MRNFVIVGLGGSYVSSLGSLIDAHTMLAELFLANEALASYAKMQTQLEIVTENGAAFSLAGGRRWEADGAWRDVSHPRLIFLPAFQVSDPQMIGALLHQSASLHQWLAAQAGGGVVIGASGAGVLHLVAAGLIADGPVSVSLRLVQQARALFPDLNIVPPDVTAMARPKIMTCADREQGLDFASRLVAEAVSEDSLRWLSIRRGLKSGPGGGEGLSDDSLVAAAQLMLREQFTANISIADIARRLGISHHTLMRRFRKALGVTPGEYRQKARIETGAVMLRETGRSVAEVGLLVGYSDARAFREAFVRQLGMTPSEFRRRKKTP